MGVLKVELFAMGLYSNISLFFWLQFFPLIFLMCLLHQLYFHLQSHYTYQVDLLSLLVEVQNLSTP